jgi:hypothetical protein
MDCENKLDEINFMGLKGSAKLYKKYYSIFRYLDLLLLVKMLLILYFHCLILDFGS